MTRTTTETATQTEATAVEAGAVEAVAVGVGRVTVPQNRWDLVPSGTRAPTVSVVCPFFDQQEQLERLLAGVELTEGDVGVREVIVADDGSARPPRIPDWYQGPEVVVVSQEDAGARPAAARNLGAAQATGEVLAFLDADMVPSPTYLATASALPAAAPEVLVVGTRRHWDLAGWGPEQVGAWLQGGPAPPRLADPEWLAAGYRRSRDLRFLDARSYQLVIGAVTTLSRSLFDELGGFDGSIVGYGAEDWDLAYRAQCAGAVLAHVEAVAHHDGPDWRGRVGPDGTKNAERRNLVSRIPAPDGTVIGPFAHTAVSIDAAGADPDALLASVVAVLAAGGSAVAIAVTGVEAVEPDPGRLGLLDHDRRVHWGGFRRPVADRSVVELELRAPATISAAGWECLVSALTPGGPGRIEVADADGVVLEARETRCRRRVDRWFAGSQKEDGWRALFGAARRCDAAAMGVGRIHPPVDLAEVFPR